MAEPNPRPRGRALFYAAALVAVAFSGTARADKADAAAPERLAKLRYEWYEQQARKEAADWEINLIAPPRPQGPSIGQFQNPTTLVSELRPVLTGDYDALRNAALKLAEAARARRDDAKKDWEEGYKQRVAFRKYADQQQTAYGFDLDTGTLPGFAPSVFDAVVIAWAVVVFVAARVLAKRARRVSLRRARRAAVTAALLVLTTVSGCSSGPAAGSGDWVAREEAELVAGTKDATAEADAATAEADRKWKAAVDGWVKLVTVPGAPETVVGDGEAQVRTRLRDAARDARLADRLAKEAESDKARLASDRAKLDGLKGDARRRTIAFAVARCMFAVVLFALAIAPYRRALRKEGALVKADAKKCPRCFGERLVVEKTGTIPGADEPARDEDSEEEEDEAPRQRYQRGKQKQPPPKRKPAAKSPTGEGETGYVECKTCGFRFLRSYQKVRRLCFPVVGVRNSGKTHLLATAYDKVRKQMAPAAATVVPAPSLGDERFDLYIDLILNLKRDAGNTLHDVNTPPDPVMIHVRDTDPAGSNTAMVNLFDYSGELVNQKIDVDRLKKQAVKMDGFMLFLDPTQLDGRKGGITLDRQLAALNEFMADMREARKVGPGDVIPVPVAVVIPKFDLLVTRNPIQGQSVPFIRKLLGEMNPSRPKQTTLGVVQDRSELVEDMLELMFRGVDVRALVESYFGNQVMFFPVSSVSLAENELGVEDLSKRTIAPFGVAEPFLWLLHMHGYEVFAQSRQ